MLDKIKNKIITGTLMLPITIGVKTRFENASEKGAKYLSTHSFTPIAKAFWGRKNNIVNAKNKCLIIKPLSTK